MEHPMFKDVRGYCPYTWMTVLIMNVNPYFTSSNTAELDFMQVCSSCRYDADDPGGGVAGPGPCMQHPLAPPPPPRDLKHSGAGAVVPTAPNFLSHA